LRAEGDLVGSFQEVLCDGRKCQLGVCFVDAEIAGSVQTEQSLHGAKALLDPEPAFRDQAVELFLRGAQRAIARRFPQDPVAVFAAQTGSVGFAGISFIGHDPARLRVLDHGFKLGLSA
jgi:hypothetical protein